MRRILLVGALGTTLILSSAGPTIAEQAPATSESAAPTALPANRAYEVTLLTGDRVTVRTRPAGCPYVQVTPVARGRVISKSCGADGHVRVVPAEVRHLLGNVLDPALFDVTVLIENRYDDASTAEIPLLVQYPNLAAAKRARTSGAVTAGLRAQRELASISAVAGRQAKKAPAKLAADASRIRLDRRIQADPRLNAPRLDANLRQVSAPQAWHAGYTGKGVRVAVLDTGIDATHPDLAGKVVEAANFSDDADTVDRFGHGTHVASIIAGTGAASGGERRGVAPDAVLLNGKVLDQHGFGTDSQVIAGMEWAAPRADVVNMSLGGYEESDGTDPLSLAVDALTRQHGTLFVTSAGNSGPFEHSVSAPGAAKTALTVGAVDADDKVADFSSRGPQVNTYAMKPEIVAPGVSIVAARATGTEGGTPIDARYTSASGTSMAAPHVAGAAAALVQRHPDWRPDRLKSALIGSADPASGGDLYAVGAGRLNVAKPLDGVVSDTGTVQFGVLPYPQTGVSEAALSWTNTGDRRASLALSASLTDRHGRTAPVSLSVSDLRLDPGASGTATVRVDRARLADRPGLYLGTVTGRVDGKVVARTPVTFYVEPRSHTLTLNAVSRTNSPAEIFGTSVTFVNLDDPAAPPLSYVNLRGTQTAQVRLPEGRYSIMAALWARDSETFRSMWDAIAGDPDVVVNRDISMTFDANQGRRISGSVAGVDTTPLVETVFWEQRGRRGELFGWNLYSFNDLFPSELYAVPNDGAGVGEFRAYEAFSLIRPGSEPSPYAYDVLRPLGDRIPADLAYVVSAAEQAKLARIDHRFYRLDLPNTGTSFKRYGLTDSGNLFGESQYDNVGTSRIDYVTPGPSWFDEAFFDGIVDSGSASEQWFRKYAPGSRTEYVWGRQPMRPGWYEDPIGTGSGCQPYPIRRTREVFDVDLTEFVDQHNRFDCLEWFDIWIANTERRLALTYNGRPIGEFNGSGGRFAIPREEGTFRLTYDLKTSLPISSRVDTAWTFRSKAPRGTEAVRVPLLAVDYELPLDLANKPTGGDAAFLVRQMHGLEPRRITGLRAWVSVDDGATWTALSVRREGADRYATVLPVPAKGQAISLKVDATAEGGGRFEQTIIRAYVG
jgi:subtilisin family serine protease